MEKTGNVRWSPLFFGIAICLTMHNQNATNEPDHLTVMVLHRAVAVGDRRRISCEQAHRLAAELGVRVSRIGEICQSEQIKIEHCQLGCFGNHHD